MNYASSSPVRYSDLSEITYVNHNGETINLNIDSSDPKNTKLSRGAFGVGSRLVGHFAVDGGSPYSPSHGAKANIDPSNLPNLYGFLHKPVGSKVEYNVTEEWAAIGMPWKLEATISRKGLLEVSQQKMLATQVVITGESIGPSNSQWHIVGIKFRETRIIDPQTNVTLTFKREWESRTAHSPDELETLELVSVKLKSGRTITLNQLASESEKKYIAKQKIPAAQKEAKIERQRVEKRRVLAAANPVRYSDLSEITYVNHNGRTINLTIDASDPNDTKFKGSWSSGDIRLVGHFAVDGGSPYSPDHGNVDTKIVDGLNLTNLYGFLHKPVGTKVKYDVLEEWNSSYDMLWKLEATISRKSLLEVNQQKMFATQVVITGESVGPTSSSWHEVGIKFRETRIIDPQTNVTLTFKREWESRTAHSPDELETLELVSVKLKSGRTITLNQLASESEKKYIAKQKIPAAQKEAKIERQRVEKRRVLAAAQAKVAADKKRRASQAMAAADKKRRASQARAAAKKKRQAAQARAAAKKKRQSLAAAQARAAAEEKRRASQVAAAARKKQEEIISVKNANEAKLFLKDFKDFVSKDPAAFDSFKMAGFFGPSQEVVSKNQYGSKKKTFHKLVKFANSNSRYRAYRVNRQTKRKQVIEAKRKTVTKNIKQLIVLLRQKVAADPLAPSTSKIIRIVGVYEKPFKGKTLNNLNKILTDLSSEMRAVGIEPPVGNSSIANSAAEKKRRASQVAAAARKKQEEAFAVKNAAGAKIFLKDFKDFVSKNPAAFDSFKMAVLFGPAQEVVSKSLDGSKENTFQKLVKFANSNKAFRAYRMNIKIKRERDIATRKKTATENIKQLIVLLRQKVAADPLAPSTSKIIRIVGVYEKPFKGKTLNNLNKILTDLSSEMRAVGIEPPVGNSSRGKKRKIVIPSFRSIPQLRGVKENDIVFLANLNSAAPHTYRDLNGAIKFEKSKIVVCAPKIKDWDRQALIFAQYKTNGLYPNHGIERGSCKGKIGAVDAIMARGVDLAKSKELPSEVAFSEGFRTKKLSLIFTVKASDVSDELKRRTILSSQYKDDIMEEARSGFGAISGNNKSSVGCVVVSDLRDAHQSFVDQASKARTFQSGIETRKNVDVSLSVAFRQLQKKTCGLIYAGEKSLKKLIEASKNSDLKITVLPVWTSASKVKRQAAVLLNKQNTSEQSKADRLAALKRKLVEDRKQRAARAAELSQQQARYRTTYGAKVTSLVAAIDTQLKSMRSQIDKTLSNKGSVRAAVKSQGFWGELPGWYGAKRQKGWEFGSTVATPADYGTATWKGRNIKAIVAKVRFLMKQPDLGEYSDTCWYVGYLADAEFSRQREPFVASCKRPDALKKWFVVNRFQTQWDLGVR